MRLAALETATAATAVAVTDGTRTHEVVADERARHTESLVPALDALLAELSLAPRDLDAVVVDVGPGRFTGLRVGVATAKGLAVATGVGLVAVTATDVLAEAVASAHAGSASPSSAIDGGARGLDVLAVVDVRRGEVAWARYEVRDGRATRTDGPALATPAALAAALAAAGVSALAVGDGAVRYRDVLAPVLSDLDDTMMVPPPSAALRLAERRLREGEPTVGHAHLHVAYVRDADAVANFAVRGEAH